MATNNLKRKLSYFCTHHGHNEMHNTDACRHLHSLGTPAQQPHNVQHLVDRARVNVEEQLKLKSDVRDNADKGLFRNIRDLETETFKKLDFVGPKSQV
jgi:hypothetical protein